MFSAKLRKSLLTAAALLLGATTVLGVVAPRKVLLVTPDDYATPWSTRIISELVSHIQKDPMVELTVARTASYDDPAGEIKQNGIADLDRDTFDLVLVSGCRLGAALAKYPALSRRHTPVLIFNMPESLSLPVSSNRNIVGFFLQGTLEENLRIGRRLRPRAENALVLCGYLATTGARNKADQTVTSTLPGVKSAIYGDGATEKEVLAAAAKLSPENSFIVIVDWFGLDMSGEVTLSGFLEKIRQVYSGPIVCGYATVLNRGAVGGMVLDPRQYAAAIGELGSRILSDPAAAALKRRHVFSAEPRFDYQELARLEIGQSQLPESAEIINLPSAMWRSHARNATLTMALVIGLCAAMAVLLFLVFRYYRTTRSSSKQSQLHDKLFAVMPVSVWVVDGEGRLLFQQNSLLTKSNPQKIDDFLAADTVAQLMKRVHWVLEYNEFASLDIRIGDTWRRAVIRKAETKLFQTDAAIVATMDVTRQVELNQKLSTLNNEQQLLLDTIPVSVIVRDRNRRLIRCNETARSVLGDDALAVDCSGDSCLCLGLKACPFKQAIESGGGSKGEFVRSDHHYYYQTTPIEDSDGELDKVVLSCMDITELVRTREELTGALEQAQVANRAKSTFLATMSHEIRTPLNAIIALSELLQHGDFPAETADNLRTINAAGQSLLNLINDVLDFSKLDADKMTIEFDWCEVGPLVRELCAIFKPLAEQRKLSLTLEMPDDLPLMRFNLDRLRQILVNLIGNAVKFTNTGSVKLVVNFAAPEGAKRGVLVCRVIDTGVGIAPEHRESIFNPFEQAVKNIQRARYVDGTGLGLSIARQLARKMGGDITLKSEVGRGSEFTLTVSDLEFRSAAAKPAAAKPEPEAVVSLPPGLKVLVVDDVATNCKVLCLVLKRLGVESESTTSVIDALDRIADGFSPSLVMSDMWMPEMSGEKFARALHAKPGCENIPIVAVTADTEASRSFDVTVFDAILLKPITAARVRETLNRFFGVSPK